MWRVFILFIFFLSGCLGAKYTPEQLKTDFTDIQLCMSAVFHGFGSVNNTEDVILEIKRRGIVSQSEWRAVAQGRTLKIGMSECSMLLSMNTPSYELTETVTRYGTSRYYVYGNGYGPYIFVDNGRVTSWTN